MTLSQSASSHLAADKLAVKIITVKSTTLIVTGGLNLRLIALSLL
jgi:hypothetical protein